MWRRMLAVAAATIGLALVVVAAYRGRQDQAPIWRGPCTVEGVMESSLLGGADVDRFALYLAPFAIVSVLHARFPEEGYGAGVWFGWIIMQAIAMEFVLPWFPEESFYLSRYAVHSVGMSYAYVCVFSWILVATVVLIAWQDASAITRGEGEELSPQA